MSGKDPKEGGVCWDCRKPAAAEDNFCRFCGRNLASFPWYYQHWGIIVLTFLALAARGRSSHFGGRNGAGVISLPNRRERDKMDEPLEQSSQLTRCEVKKASEQGS